MPFPGGQAIRGRVREMKSWKRESERDREKESTPPLFVPQMGEFSSLEAPAYVAVHRRGCEAHFFLSELWTRVAISDGFMPAGLSRLRIVRGFQTANLSTNSRGSACEIEARGESGDWSALSHSLSLPLSLVFSTNRITPSARAVVPDWERRRVLFSSGSFSRDSVRSVWTFL